jgi:hypothetical protein
MDNATMKELDNLYIGKNYNFGSIFGIKFVVCSTKKKDFSIQSYVKTFSCNGGHLEFLLIKKKVT